MGYRIENYNLDELNRIAIPGTVPHTLFWVLPVGRWPQTELDELWKLFTSDGSQCNNYGLMLIKKEGNPAPESSAISLVSAGATLRDLMPEGTEHFVRPSEFDDRARKLFVISGGFPQPGWGVLIDWRTNARSFERLIWSVNSRLEANSEVPYDLEVFTKAAADFHDWHNLEGFPPHQRDLDPLEGQFSATEKVDDLFFEGLTALDTKDFRVAWKKLDAAIDSLRNIPWLETLGNNLRSLGGVQKALSSAEALLAVPPEVLASEVLPKVDSLILDPTLMETVFRSVSSDMVKRALQGALFARKQGALESLGEMQLWAQQKLTQEPQRLAELVSEARKEIAAQLSQRRAAQMEARRDADRNLKSWRDRTGRARLAFHDSAEKATMLQWQLGPQFLVAFEDICREQGLGPKTIPWDPARMLGWKILARSIDVAVYDLQVAARELSSSATVDSAAVSDIMGPADGSYFTDYVHYIALSKPGSSARSVARDLVSRLLRPAQMNRLIRLHGGQIAEGASPVEMADTFLDSIGWRRVDESCEVPLAACARPSDDPRSNSETMAPGNDLRIIVESFCKDLLDVFVSKLGYRERQVWDAIEERAPQYRPSSHPRDWNYEVSHLSIGQATILLPILGSLAFPAVANKVTELSNALAAIAKVLNRESHHQQRDQEPLSDTAGVPDLIRQLLDCSKACLGGLPWHLETSTVYGEQPKIVTGEAWSHGCPTPRLLRVILWGGSSSSRHVLLWNKTGRNPIITDPMLVVRPHA